jgi:hypothetical protein
MSSGGLAVVAASSFGSVSDCAQALAELANAASTTMASRANLAPYV